MVLFPFCLRFSIPRARTALVTCVRSFVPLPSLFSFPCRRRSCVFGFRLDDGRDLHTANECMTKTNMPARVARRDNSWHTFVNGGNHVGVPSVYPAHSTKPNQTESIRNIDEPKNSNGFSFQCWGVDSINAPDLQEIKTHRLSKEAGQLDSLSISENGR